MPNDPKIELQIQIHIQLWSHYNLVYWILFGASLFGLILSGSILLLVYLIGQTYFAIQIIVGSIFFLLSIVSYLLFKITAKQHSYKLYEKQSIAELSKTSVKEYLPSITDLDISRFGMINGFVVSSTLLYILMMLFLNSSFTVFMILIFSKNSPLVPYLIFFILLGFSVVLYLPWIQMAKNWKLQKRNSEKG